MEIEKLKSNMKALGARVQELSAESTFNEEQTKNAFIMPFFQNLGYDVFDPHEFIPEFTADIGVKKGERVDYAVSLKGKPEILVECKPLAEDLNKYDGQLYRYFTVTTSKFGVLTNGREYRFFTDLDNPNKMDRRPFLVIDIVKIKDNQISEIAKFHKEQFDVDKILSSASELKYLNNLKDFFEKNFKKPSDDFIRLILAEVYEGQKNQKVVDKFKPLVIKGFAQFVSDRVSDKLNAALDVELPDSAEKTAEIEKLEKSAKIVTTPEEIEAYTVTKAILQDVIEPDRVGYRDNASYFNVLLDSNINKWILRFYSNGVKRSITIHDGQSYVLDSALDIYNYKKEISDAVGKILKGASKSSSKKIE